MFRDFFRDECQLESIERNTELTNHDYTTTFIVAELSKDREQMLKTIW